MKNNKKRPNNQEFDPYSIDKLSNVKPGTKIGFLKFWVSGAAFFLTFTAFNLDILDLFAALILILLIGVEYIVNKVIEWMNNEKQPTLKYLPHHVNRKSILSLGMTFIYVVTMVMGSYFLIEGFMSLGIPSIGMLMFGFENVGIDPITFGLVYVVVDYVWVTLKNLMRAKLQHKKEQS